MKGNGFAPVLLLLWSCEGSPKSGPLMRWEAALPSIAAVADVSPPALEPARDPVQAAPPRCDPVGPLDVLFIGNSYVILNDTPTLLAAMAADAGLEYRVERSAVGGTAFEDHLQRPKTREVLQARAWDVVILQSHSLDPLRNPSGFSAAGARLINMVRGVGAEALLFETWPRRSGHNLYGYMEVTGGSPEAMLARVSAGYEALADQAGVPVIPVGRSWLSLVRDYPDYDPYTRDGAHPGKFGAYLSAAVVFTVLTGRDPRGVVRPHGIPGDHARIALRVAAQQVQPACRWEKPSIFIERPGEIDASP